MATVKYSEKDAKYKEWRENHTYVIDKLEVGEAVSIVINVSNEVTIIDGIVTKVASTTAHVESESEYKIFHRSWKSYHAVRGYWKHVDLYVEK